MKTIKFGIIGAGLMGREFASAAARRGHLPEMTARPVITAVCDKSAGLFDWYREICPSAGLFTDDYHKLLASPDVDAVYCAVPHNLHEEIYCAVIKAGKHLMGEKPFGIDEPANSAILSCIEKHPDCFARCSSEFPFYPAVQRIGGMIESGAFGEIIEVNAAFCHSSDLDPDKPLNWKRMIEINGEYGSMGDLGMHVCHVPFRAGWFPKNVRAILSDIVKDRPDGKGGRAPCRTWDNATLCCEAEDPATGFPFPLTLKTHRISPGDKNTWRIEILGTRASVRFSTKNPKLLEIMEYKGGEQAWQHIDMGHETAFKSITGGIFEPGFSDVILQMWAAFICELNGESAPGKFATCVTPEETAMSHSLFTAALRSNKEKSVEEVRGKALGVSR